MPATPDISPTAPTAQAAPVRVLIVDDNKIYRDAFRRNLMLQNYEVLEAENADEALQCVATDSPDVVITDLQMRTETEGIDLIRQLHAVNPLLPVIMISAVGSFEEGALAKQHGAAAVIAKSRIEDEISRLYTAIEEARENARGLAETDRLLEPARKAAADDQADPAQALEVLRKILADESAGSYLRAEAYNLYAELDSRRLLAESKASADRASAEAASPMPAASSLGDLEDKLRVELPDYNNFADESKESLRIAEFLYIHQSAKPGGLDFSRNVGFSYCFAVENETKRRMAKRLQKFLNSEQTYLAISEMMENKNQNLSVYYHQHILLLLRNRPMEFTIDNVKQTFRRILEHQSRYKPDGLKALGIMLVAFGRSYSWPRGGKQARVDNPLGIKGLNTEDEVLQFAALLISLQHYRNPYIHPEISSMEKLSIIRSTAFECLNMMSRLQ